MTTLDHIRTVLAAYPAVLAELPTALPVLGRYTMAGSDGEAATLALLARLPEIERLLPPHPWRPTSASLADAIAAIERANSPLPQLPDDALRERYDRADRVREAVAAVDLAEAERARAAVVAQDVAALDALHASLRGRVPAARAEEEQIHRAHAAMRDLREVVEAHLRALIAERSRLFRQA